MNPQRRRNFAKNAIIAAAARNRLPTIYPTRFYATDGGLASYGGDYVDIFRRTATYVDRILRGEKPGDLPVQFPTKFSLHGVGVAGQQRLPCPISKNPRLGTGV